MSNRDRVLDFLNSVGPEGATNSDVVSRTGIKPHQQVFQITQALMRKGLIKGVQSGKDWRFWSRDRGPSQLTEQQRRISKTQRNNETTMAYDWDTPWTVDLTLKMDWTPTGRVILSEDGKLQFPIAPATAGLYRLRVRKSDRESLYIGETEDLVRRFGNYRNPGPTQQTSVRINARLRADLEAGAEVGLSIVTERAWIGRPDGTQSVADLSLKAVRCLFENAAIVASNASEIESLNR
jgi:hypothetical protein